MPSMVSIERPSASTPSTRHEQTRRPSTVTLQAPHDVEVSTQETQTDAGTYRHFRLGDLHVHLRDELMIVPGEVVVCDVKVALKRWGPKQSDPSRSARYNYAFILDAVPSTSEEAVFRVVFHTGERRRRDFYLGQGGRYALRMPNGRVDQDFEIVPISGSAADMSRIPPTTFSGSEDDGETAMGAALRAASLV